jgi:hypothetical protein
MAAFSTFTYAKKYYVSQEIEFVTEPDADFGETYKPPEDLINLLADNITVSNVGLFGSKVGIGTTTPSRALEVIGNALISGITTFNRDIYLDGPLRDRFRNKGTLGQVLLTDAIGVFWSDVSGVGTPLQTIGIYDEGAFIGTVSNLNFIDGTDPGNLVNATLNANPTFANITISDRWSLSGPNVYRMSNVGIQNNNPTSTLDITGTLHAIGVVDFDSTLNVDGAATLQTTLNVKGATDLDSTLNVDGDATLNLTLDVDGATTLNNTLDVDGATTLNNTLDVDGATTLNNTLDVDGATTLNNTLDVDLATTLNSTLDVDGATTLNNTLDVDLATTLNSTLDVDGATTLNLTLDVDGATTLNNTLQVGPSGTVITTTGIGSVGIGTNLPSKGLDIANQVLIQKAVYDSNRNVGYKTEFYKTPRTVLGQVGVNTAGEVISDRFFDAANLIRLNLDFIAAEAVGFITSTDYLSGSFSVPGVSSCRDDIKKILKSITLDITRGGNSQSVGAGLSYYNGGSLIHITSGAQQTATVVAITTAAQISQKVINNVLLTKSYQSGVNSIRQIRDLTIQDDASVNSNANFGGCSNVVSAIYTCAGIVNAIIGGGTGSAPVITQPDGKVVWVPPGTDVRNLVWVNKYGNDDNGGKTEGDAKLTIAAAAAVAHPGDTIMVRSGVYYENNPIGLRTDVAISGQDLRLVTVVPQNSGKDIFHVRRGCLIENMNFACDTGQSNPGGGALAFPPTTTDIVAGKSHSAVSGYTAPGPATEGPSGRWRSPYVRNCTNFMPLSIGMKINGDHATASTIGADLKSMVCDSFTQYNEAGIGVSLTNNAYAQLVSIFTINCDIAIYADTGGSCDLTNSNSSFGNFGLVAVGLGRTEFTGRVIRDTPAESDTVGLTSVFDGSGTSRRPYDGQALWFKINLDNYPDAVGSGIISAPMQRLASFTVINSASTYSSTSPPIIFIQDIDGITVPKGPQGIVAEASASIDDTTGKIVSIDVINSGRNYLPTQDIRVVIDGTVQSTDDYIANMEPIYFTVSESTQVISPTGITTTTFNEFIPYELFENDPIELRRITRILTSSHSFEYIGAGTDINTATPQFGGVPIKANEIVARDGAQIPFTSTDQKGNFDIGDGIQINQTTSTISGRDFSRAIQAEVTPLILALR